MFQPLSRGLWNLTAVCCEFPILPAMTDGMEAMKLSLGERTRKSSQIAAQSREIIDLHDNQMSAALATFFGFARNCAALHSSSKLCSAASRASRTCCPTAIRATIASAAANPSAAAAACSAERAESFRSQQSAKPDCERRGIEGPAVLRAAEFPDAGELRARTAHDRRTKIQSSRAVFV